jgi:hypothetical protein
LDRHGEAGVARVVRALGDDYGFLLTDPIASEWYPETSLQRSLGAVSTVTCEREPEKFCEFIEACTVFGINRLLRIVLALSSPAYVLAKMPALWARHRRNNGALSVEIRTRSARLSYSSFPFFDDANYRIMIRGILRKALEMSSGERPDVIVRDFTRDCLTVDMYFPTLRLR